MSEAFPDATQKHHYTVGPVVIDIETGKRASGDGWLDLGISLREGERRLHHIFPNIGKDDCRAFLFSLDEGYVGDKLFGNSRFEPDFSQTCKKIRSWMRSEDHFDLAMARDIRRSISRAEDAFRADPASRANEGVYVESLLSSLARTEGLDDVGGFMAKRQTRGFKRFMAKVWHPFTTALRQELFLEASATEQEPDSCPEI